MKKAFTLLEIVIFLAIFSIIIVAFLVIFVSLVNLQSNQSAVAEVNQESQFLLNQIQYNVASARLIDMTLDSAAGMLTLREFASSLDPTYITLSGGVAYLQQGSGSQLQSLTSNKVVVSNLLFTRHFNLNGSSTPFGTDSVSFSFTMSATSTNNQAYSQTFRSSATVLVPVGKIAMVQQANVASSTPSVSSLAATYTTANDTSSLLIAVVANTTSSATTTLADSAGNTWNIIASTSYPAYNTKLTVWDALNAKNSFNTVTASFGPGAGYATLYIYEYRGASTSSSFDASSTQLQPNTQTPSSGSANATSAVELLFGATYNGAALVPSSGAGFTLETSSTVSYAFVEDSTQYVTGPVAASWQYSGSTPSSSALIVTFK
jgi:type II secretory pathway pseudopilin PulG